MVRIPQEDQYNEPGQVDGQDHFVNPYHFVGTPDRQATENELGDRAPHPHGVAAAATYSGKIPITITTKTPLLLPDQARAEYPDGGGTTLSTRRNPVGAPLLSGSTVKGMLRSSYEMITNSRFPRLNDDMSKKRAFRKRPDRHEVFYLSRVTEVEENGEVAVQCIGIFDFGRLGPHAPDPVVRVPRTGAVRQSLEQIFGTEGPAASRFHGQQVQVWITACNREHPLRPIWRVEKVQEVGDEFGQCPPAPDSQTQEQTWIKATGVLHWTGSQFPAGHNNPGKQYESIFLDQESIVHHSGHDHEIDYQDIVIPADFVDSMNAAIDSFVAAHPHENENDKRDNYGSYVWNPENWRLKVGSTVYLRYYRDENRYIEEKLLGIAPWMLGRESFQVPPLDLLHENHRPAVERKQLSPADRVFGWIADNPERKQDARAHRSQLRIDQPWTESLEPIVDAPFNEANDRLRLTTLNGPKTSQFRFYVGLGEEQAPIPTGTPLSPNNGYVEGNRLRGRKTYFPHAEVFENEEYWGNAGINYGNVYREFVSADNAHQAVSTSVRDWVRAGVQFKTTLTVENLTAVELGALLWLLALPDNAVLGLGLGKPLGFGAVRVEACWDDVGIVSTDNLQEHYLTIGENPEQLNIESLQQLVDNVHQEMDTRVKVDFLRSRLGFQGVPVHYPRTVADPQNNNGYEWWVENERTGQNHPGKKLSLPPLENPSLPLDPH